MILQDFLKLVTDEEARIELEIDSEGAEDYLYESFWLSDYRCGFDNYYDDCEVTGFRFTTEFSESDITIEIVK